MLKKSGKKETNFSELKGFYTLGIDSDLFRTGYLIITPRSL